LFETTFLLRTGELARVLLLIKSTRKKRGRGDAPVAKRSGWVSAKRELRSSRKAPRPRTKYKLFLPVVLVVSNLNIQTF
jgi:hypothetical protein